jgi:hypothetical protein
MARQFERGVGDWLSKVRQNVYALSDLVHSLETVYGGDSDGIGLRSMGAFKKLASQLETNSVVKTLFVPKAIRFTKKMLNL